jgi:hypothetical protein
MGNKETKGEDVLDGCGSIRSISSLPLPEELVRWSALFGLVWLWLV